MSIKERISKLENRPDLKVVILEIREDNHVYTQEQRDAALAVGRAKADVRGGGPIYVDLTMYGHDKEQPVQ